MSDEDYSISTSCVVADFMSYRLQKAGYTWQISPTRNCPNNPVTDTMRKLCEEFEKRYEKQFAEMFSDCSAVDMNQESYIAVLDNVITQDIHWGRIVGVFTYAGAMAVYCMKSNKKDKVDLIREWTCSFVHHKVENWINQNGGWKGLVDFYNNGQPKQEAQKNGGWGILLGGALGAFAIGALIVNRA